MKVVAICGNAGTGKDTAANCLVENHGFVTMAFADPLKELAQDIFEFSWTQLWGASALRNKIDIRYYEDSVEWKSSRMRAQSKINKILVDLFGPDVDLSGSGREELHFWKMFDYLEEHHPNLSPRIAIQTIGTEWGRYLDEDLWTNLLVKRIKSSPNKVVISDARFKNELDALKSVKAFIVRIHRKEAEDDSTTLGVGNHRSEAELNEINDGYYDMVIHNNHSMEQFIKAVNLIPSCMKH